MNNVSINENVLSPFNVFKYKKKYLKIVKYFKWFPNTKTRLLMALRDDIDYNWAFVINNNTNEDLCKLYEKINFIIEKEGI